MSGTIAPARRHLFPGTTIYDLIDFVDAGVLPELGVPPDVANATAFGAYINSDSFRSRGAEIDPEVDLGHGLRMSGEATPIWTPW